MKSAERRFFEYVKTARKRENAKGVGRKTAFCLLGAKIARMGNC